MVRCGIVLFRSRLQFIKILVVITLVYIGFELYKTRPAREIFSISTYLPSNISNLLPTVTNHRKLNQVTPRSSLASKTTNPTTMPSECELPEQHHNLHSSLARRFPHIIIVGFGKAGTRALYQMIRMHPDIAGATSEIRFFSNDENYKKGLQFYIGLLPITNPQQKTIVKSPDYIIKPAAASRLRRALSQCHLAKDIKFIVILRDPFKRAVSEYLQYKIDLWSSKKQELAPFEKLSVKESGQINNLNKQVNASIYSYHLKNWLKYFDMKQICFVNGENLVKNPYSELKTLENCLGLRSFIQLRHFYFNKSKGYYCPVYLQGRPQCLSANKGRTHPKIDNEVERRLREFYRPFNQQLYNLTGVNYKWA